MTTLKELTEFWRGDEDVTGWHSPRLCYLICLHVKPNQLADLHHQLWPNQEWGDVDQEDRACIEEGFSLWTKHRKKT